MHLTKFCIDRQFLSEDVSEKAGNFKGFPLKLYDEKLNANLTEYSKH